MQYPSIRIEGPILSGDIIDAVERAEKGFQKAKDFGLDPTSKVKDEIANAWADARDQWRIYRRKVDSLKEGATGTTETRNLWMTPLLGLLGYQVELAGKGEEVNGRNYAISHRDISRDGFPAHIVGCNDSLDRRRVEGGTRISPHALVQEYLNLTEHLFAIVTNGRFLRLLRDSTRLIKLSFLEFDLDRMFEEELFADFAILFRLVHVSRMPRTQDSAAESIIEIYHQDALDSGSRIRDGLSAAVEKSIKSLANGFLSHPANDTLRQSIVSGETDNKTFYKWQLRLIYRLLFLMVIEERDLIFSRDAKQHHREIYYDYYSVGRLRRLSEHRHFADRAYQDAWTGLRHTFRLFEDIGYGQKLEIAPLAGELFDSRAIGLLNECRLDNEILLTCLKNLSLFTNPITKQLMRVNYAALNVEEFGSVYEGLLEYDPQVLEIDGRFEFNFVAGDDRAASGSHYTPDELVQPLIKHSLDYIIAEKLKEANPQQALLSITVCDVACGSGHILLNAARRIATELATLRTGEDLPSPMALRTAVRDVIRNCIYGVDLNPLAVELCKVGLWLEAHVPGEPLNFLDHHIKCGNAIVGLACREELQRGIPDEAFKTLPDDEKAVAAELRKQNKEERKGYQSLDFGGRAATDLDALRDDFSSVANLPESTPKEIRQKQKAHDEFRRGIHLRNLKTLADIQVAQFYIPKTPEARRKITTHDQYRRYLRGENPHPEPTAYAQAIAHRKRFFHWFLEFPDVFANGGFDCILGNPPYLGGSRISTAYGDRVLTYLKQAFNPIDGRVDLVAYFLRRDYALLKIGGFVSIITTNSISQGDTRLAGLEHLSKYERATMRFAIASTHWPGQAAVRVSLVCLAKNRESGEQVLNGKRVAFISSYLDDSTDLGEPMRLSTNEGQSFIGSVVIGEGFILTPDRRRELVAKNELNANVTFPYLGGRDLNTSPSQIASRYIINFFDWPLARAQSDAPDCLEIVDRLVRPERAKLKDKGYREKWWQYGRRGVELYESIAQTSRTLVIAKVSRTVAPCFASTDQVFADKVIVFSLNRDWHFAVLQSCFHYEWAWKYCTTMKSDLSYMPRAIYQTFAFPRSITADDVGEVGLIGHSYHEHRRQLMLQIQLGLTKTYNLFHDPKLSPEIVAKASKQDADVAAKSYSRLLRLRELHREMDEAVLAAYGWHEPSDVGPRIDLRHDFYEVDYLPENDRIRYTIHPDARREILKRLLKLNQQRHAEEQAEANGAEAKKGSRGTKNGAEGGKDLEKLPLFD